MNLKWVLGIVLVLVLVGTVSAETLTFYPPSSGDGTIKCQKANTSWSDMMTCASGGSVSYLENTTMDGYSADKETNTYAWVQKTVYANIDTSSIPDNAVIDSATFYQYRVDSSTGLGNDTVFIVPFTVDGGLSADDWDNFGTGYSNVWSDTNYVGAMSAASYHGYNFNSLGIANISKTGTTSFGITLGNITNNTEPTWVTGSYKHTFFQGYTNEYATYDATKRPYLNVTYHVPETTLYPMNDSYINETRISPNSDTTLPPTGFNISKNTTPGEYEWASFVIKAPPDVSPTDYQISATSLTDADGAGHAAISTASLDLRTVKVWYQSDDDAISFTTAGYYLSPELLLKNDSIVRVDLTNQTNEVWVKNATFEGYFHIDNQTAALGGFPSDTLIYDNATTSGDPQPFALASNQNKQIWVTTNISSGTPAGNYTGKIWANSSTTNPIAINITLRVLPFTLQNASLDHGLFYRGVLNSSTVTEQTSEWKDSVQYTAELNDMKTHGIEYPVVYQDDDSQLDAALLLRSGIDLPKDKIYLMGLSSRPGNGTSPAQLAAVAAKVTNWRNHTETYGFGDNYFYGIDEATGTDLTSQRAAWTEVRNNSGKTYVASWQTNPDGLDTMRDVLDTAIRGSAINSTEAALWHAEGHEIFLYNRPQMGVENPEIYREYYGFRLWVSGYDGAMDYAYQHDYGQSIWNDYDHASMRDHVAAYPKTDGVIDTIQWEGYREGVDDSRYADTLSYITGNTTEATTIINAGIAAGVDMSVIRGNLIDAILNAEDDPPVANFTAVPTSGNVPLTVQFIDNSTYPVNWSWYIDANTTPFATTQNPSYVFTGNQTYTIRLNVSNANGYSWMNRTAYISGLAVTPVAAFSGVPVISTTSITTTFTDASTNTPTTWAWYLGPNTTAFSNLQNPTLTITSYAGASYDINLYASNAAGGDWENKSGYLTMNPDITKQVCISDSSTGHVTSALNTIGIMLTVLGLVGIIYSLLGAGGYTGGRSNYGGSGTVNTWLIVGSVLAIMIGAVMLIMGYLIISSAMGMSVACL